MNPGGQPGHLEHPIHLDHPGHLDHLELLLACLGRNLSFLLLYYSFVFQQILSLLSTDHLQAPQIRVLSLGYRLRNCAQSIPQQNLAEVTRPVQSPDFLIYL